MNPITIKRFFLLVLALCVFNSVFAVQYVSLYVRESQTVSCPSLPYGYTVYSCQFASPSTAVTAYSIGHYGGSIKVNSYFTGTISVECTQYYHYNIGNFTYWDNRTLYYIVSCTPINITLSSTSLSLAPGDYHNLTYSESPMTYSYSPVVTWESSNPGVAQVSSTGRIHAISSGTATITARNSSGPNKTCTVVVQSPSPTSIDVTPGTISFPKGQSRSLSHTVTPSTASYSLQWTSSNTSVATVNNGTVYGVAPGTATITARVVGTSITDVCYVTVQPVNPTAISVAHSRSVNVGQNITLNPSVTPSNADYTITWTSSNTSIATVDGGVVHGVDNGTVRITAHINGTSLQDTCRVVVNRPTLVLCASALSGWVTPGTTIALTASNNGASIRYTTDGSTPTESSPLYSGPIAVNDSITLKAIAYHPNYYPSEELVCNYKVNNFQIVEQNPSNNSSTSLSIIIPSVTFNKPFSEGQNYSDVKLFVGNTLSEVTSDGSEVSGEKFVVGNTLYFIPSEYTNDHTKAFRFDVPAGALLSEDQEPNWEKSVVYSVGSQNALQLVQNIGFAESEDSLLLSVGEWHILHPFIEPVSGAYDTLYWNVADPSVVFVSQYGVVEALSVGSTQVSLVVMVGDSVYTALSHISVTRQFQVSTAVSDTLVGTVYGSGIFAYLNQTTITAFAGTCYHFVRWNDGNTDNPRTFTLTQDTLFTAFFASNDAVIGYDTAVVCDSFCWNAVTYTASGLYPLDAITTQGCDSTVYLTLTVHHSVERRIFAYASHSYTWHDTTYTEGGIYQWHGTTVDGCDSTETLELTIGSQGIHPETNHQLVIVYPNPTTGWINVNARNVQSIEVFDQAGRHVAMFEYADRIDLSGLPTGHYLLRVRMKDGFSLHRVLLK